MPTYYSQLAVKYHMFNMSEQRKKSQTYLYFPIHQVYTQYHYYHLLIQVKQNLYLYLHNIQFSLISET